MNATVKDEIKAENVHHTNEINARNLDQYHAMLNSFNTQATLIVGFALNSINHDNLSALAPMSQNTASTRAVATSLVAFLAVPPSRAYRSHSLA